LSSAIRRFPPSSELRADAASVKAKNGIECECSARIAAHNSQATTAGNVGKPPSITAAHSDMSSPTSLSHF
jgi:hypothetical protein